MTRARSAVLSASLRFATIGCASRATQAAGRIHVGMTGLQVEERLGKPVSRDVQPQTGEVWTYTYAADISTFPRTIALSICEIALNTAIFAVAIAAAFRGSGGAGPLTWIHLDSRSIEIGFASGRVHSIVVSR